LAYKFRLWERRLRKDRGQNAAVKDGQRTVRRQRRRFISLWIRRKRRAVDIDDAAGGRDVGRKL